MRVALGSAALLLSLTACGGADTDVPVATEASSGAAAAAAPAPDPGALAEDFFERATSNGYINTAEAAVATGSFAATCKPAGGLPAGYSKPGDPVFQCQAPGTKVYGMSGEATPPAIAAPASSSTAKVLPAYSPGHECDYVLTVNTQNPEGYFVANAEVTNANAEPMTATVTASWEQLGTAPVTSTQTVELPPGSTTVRFNVTFTEEELDRTVDGPDGHVVCDVVVT